jgi:hypothetical protein
MNARIVLLNILIEQRGICREISRFLGIPERDPCMHMEEDIVWIQTTWCKASHAQQKSGENFL